LYLYASQPVSATQPQWDGTEEEDSENNGDSGASPDTSLDDLPVYTPAITEDELSVFLETQYKGSAIWVWNRQENFTGGSWSSKPSMQVMGKTADGLHRILKWTYDGTAYQNLPTGVIFVPTGQNQTADLQYVNHGYYMEGVYDHTVTELTDIRTVATDNDSAVTTLFDLSGRRVVTAGTHPQHGIYVRHGRKICF